MATTREREMLDRHITGNYGEDQFMNEDDYQDGRLFDITCTIGTVYPDASSKQTPYEAAFSMIGQHGTTGVFKFPLEHGGECVVHVDWINVPAPQGDGK